MKRNNMRWLSGWLVFCLLFGVVSVGFSEDMGITLANEVVIEDDLEMRTEEDGDSLQDIDLGQDVDVEAISDIVLDLDGEIELNEGLDEQITVEAENIQTNAGRTFTIRNVTLPVPNNTSDGVIKNGAIAGGYKNTTGCYAFASYIYELIWKRAFNQRDTFDFITSKGAVISTTAENLKLWVLQAGPGAVLRVTSRSSWIDDDNSGHSIVIVDADDNGAWLYQSSGADYGASIMNNNSVTYYSWSTFADKCQKSKDGFTSNGKYIKYIKYPGNDFFRKQPSAETLQFTNVTYPKTFRINTYAGWTLGGGMLESNYDLKTLKSQILNSSGGVVSSATVSISGKSYAIRNLDTYSRSDNGVKFSYIKTAGSYKWVLTATDSNGRSLTLVMPFTAVTSGSTVTATASDKYRNSSAYLDLNGWIDGKACSNFGNVGTADVYINGKMVANDVKDYWAKWPVGTSYEIKDIRANSGYSYNGVYSGSLSGKVGSDTTIVVLRFDKKATSAYLDLNGWIDGKECSNLGNGGTVDVYINGKMVANDVKDYWAKWPVGTSYEIKDIRAKTGYTYNGVYSGSISGKVGSNTTLIVLRFDKKTQSASTLHFTNVTYPKTFRINTYAGWALSGGTLESNYELRTLKSQIINSSGGVVSSGSVSISGKSYAIRNLDTYSRNDNGVKFSYIRTAGNYKWVLTATDSSGRSLTLTMPFTAVSSGSTVTATASLQ